MVKKRTRHPLGDTAIEAGMSKEQRTQRIIRRLRKYGSYNRQQPESRVNSYSGVHTQENNWSGKISKYDPDAWRRKCWTTEEIKLKWLAYCDLKRHFRGSAQKLADATGYSINTVYTWSRQGHISAPAADKIGKDPMIPFTREQIRPDISEEGWRRFDEYHTNS